MESILAKLRATPIGSNPENLTALAAYEDTATHNRVEEFCRLLSRQFGPKCQVTKQMWLLNELRSPQLRAIAAADAAAVDLVIVAVHHAEALPEELCDWVKLWLGRKGKRPNALVALFDPAYRGDSSRLRAFLAEAARRGRLEFLEQSEEAPD
jgi:hypothetical protein